VPIPSNGKYDQIKLIFEKASSILSNALVLIENSFAQSVTQKSSRRKVNCLSSSRSEDFFVSNVKSGVALRKFVIALVHMYENS